MRLPLLSIAAQLPTATSPQQTLDHDAISGVMEPTVGYVWPEVDAEADSLAQPVLLVSAPGAMGKSEAARNLAARLNAPYIDLAQLHVGRGSLVGELTKAFGSVNADSFRQDVRAGSVALVLDSTDEAQLRSGAENYFEFLKDLEWLLDLERNTAQAIIFGRSDSIEITEAALRAIEVPASHVRLAPLNYDAAGELVDSILDGTDYELHRNQPEPFRRLRDETFRSMARALIVESTDNESLDIASEWSQIEGFLGYPPVLKAIAERLRVKNPQLEVAALASSGEAVRRRQRGVLLREVVETILDRESEKVRVAIGKSLALREDEPVRVTLYTRDEQAARLLQFNGVQGISNLQPAHLDGSDRDHYEDLIAPFVADHPFLRRGRFTNVVFSDYLRAWAVSAPTGAVMTQSRPAFLSSLPAVGPFFAMFLSAIASESGEDAGIPEDLVDDAIRSNAIGAPGSHAVFSHREGRPAQLRLIDADARLENEEIRFLVQDPSGVLILSSPISRVSVASRYGVVVRAGRAGVIEFGPDALIIAEDVEFEGGGIHVLAGPSSLSGIIARSSAKHDGDFKVVAHVDGSLIASWPDMWHQWANFTITPNSPKSRPVPRALGAQVIVAVRKLLLSFHKTSVEKPAVSADKLDRVLVGENDVTATVRDVLLSMKVIERQGSQYYLDVAALGDHGVSWSDISGSDPYASLRPFSEIVVNSTLFITRHLNN